MKYYKKLIGERIYLSPVSIEDAEKYVEWFSDFKMTDKSGTQRLLLNSVSGAIIGHPNKGRVHITDAGITIYDTNNKTRSVINTSGLDVKDTDGSTSVALFAASSNFFLNSSL